MTVVCMSNVPLFIEQRKAVEEVERATRRAVLGAKFLWNNGVALFLLNGPVNLRSKLVLKALAAETGQCPALERSNHSSLDLPGASEYVNVRFIAVNPRRDLSHWRQSDMDEYMRAEHGWDRSATSTDVEELFQAAVQVSGEAKVLFDSSYVPHGAFGIAKRAGRLYGQVFVRFSQVEEARRILAADGLLCRLRGVQCVARVEGMDTAQINMVRFRRWSPNPYLIDDGSAPPALVDDAPREVKHSRRSPPPPIVHPFSWDIPFSWDCAGKNAETRQSPELALDSAPDVRSPLFGDW